MAGNSLLSAFRKSLVSQALTLGIALHLFNVSIDPADPLSFSGREDISINEIESFAEFFLEELADWTNFFEEYDDRESDSSLQKSSVSLIYVLTTSCMLNVPELDQALPEENLHALHVCTAFLNTVTPPPKVV